ncbi:FkbM family methyltransferase [Kingella kingae]|uniref:FkbM family methyltransferase n=1 Tax=Kingella kingae TaxID=504 RepID=UPI00255067BB|nr:FkbM family methyltransferase [Kingella kingae]MDK4537114.1 FkbM family methyltransferase [Kingella kingae]MDK4539540.1 FkbM family methyltransferase [Kingella kingae]MDK4546186.1 FkbM family methyltransferase [Kingella kingae]
MIQIIAKPQLYTVGDTQYLLTQGRDLISSHLKAGQRWEGFVVDLIAMYLSRIEKPVFVDIGANLGAISVPIAQFLQPRGGQVHSIEAQRAVFYQLCGNIFANNVSQNCFAYHTALGDYDGEISIPVLDTNNTANVGALSLDKEIRANQGEWDESQFQSYEMIKITTLDQLDLPLASMIKMDVEGMELEVLRGGGGWIQKSQFPPILFEVWYHVKGCQTKQDELWKLLQDMSYELCIYGDLGIAQHKSHPCFSYSNNPENNSFTVSLINP